MKKQILSTILLIGLHFLVVAQDTIPMVEIHQLDVGTGDGALINIRDTSGEIAHSILIDAGKRHMDNDIRGYLKDNAKRNGIYVHLDYIISSHYHEDHIGGLVGSKERAKRDILCDQGFSGVLGDSTIKYYALLDKGDAEPIPDLTTKGRKPTFFANYRYLGNARGRRILVGVDPASRGSTFNYIPPPFSRPLPPPPPQLALGGSISLGRDANGIPITLQLVVADARVHTPGLPLGIYDVADTLGITRSNRNKGAKKNENNWGLVWVLKYGAFRFFTGGDIGTGGLSNTDKMNTDCSANCNQYFNIETPLSEALKLIYRRPVEAPGHICAQKISHHGSCCSTSISFWQTLRSSLGIVSAGNEKGFGHPTQEIVSRMDTEKWMTDSLENASVKNYFMTELHDARNIDLNKGSTSGSKGWVATLDTIQDALINTRDTMQNGGVLYSLYENTNLGDVRINVYKEKGGISIARRSQFEVESFDYTGMYRSIFINCHEQ